MVNRQRFLLDDLDSEGFPVPKPRDPLPLLALNLGRTADHGIVQALLADHKCLHCDPPQHYIGTEGTVLCCKPETWIEEARQFVIEADRAMDLGAKGDLIRSMQDCANINHDGITRLSDSYAPDAYFGHKR